MRFCLKWSTLHHSPFLTAQMSVFMVFCGPHLPLAFQFVCGPGGRFPFVLLRRRRRSRDTVKIVGFVRGSLLETFVLFVWNFPPLFSISAGLHFPSPLKTQSKFVFPSVDILQRACFWNLVACTRICVSGDNFVTSWKILLSLFLIWSPFLFAKTRHMSHWFRSLPHMRHFSTPPKRMFFRPT